MKICRQSADIVVSLYADTLEDVGIDGPLRKELDSVEFAGFFCKYVNKLFANDFTFLFRIADAGQLIQKTVDRVDVDQVGTELIFKYLDNLFRLAFAEQAVVDMDAGKLVADCLDQQSSDNGRVNTAGESKKHFLRTDLAAQSGNLFIDECFCEFRRSDTLQGFRSEIVCHS